MKTLVCLSASVMLLISSPAYAQHPKTVKGNPYAGGSAFFLAK